MARLYFAFQGVAGLLWWVGVFVFVPLRQATLGGLPLEIAYLDVPLFVVGSWAAAVGSRLIAVGVLLWCLLVTAAMLVYTTIVREAAWGLILMSLATGGTALATTVLALGHVPTEWLIQGPFVFRTTTDHEAHLARTLRQLIAFWVVFLAVLPVGLVWLERRWRIDVDLPSGLRLLGVALFLLFSALGVASALTMARRGEGTPLPSTMAKRLVISGPYRFVRNPMAVAGIGQGTAVGLSMGSWIVVAYALVGSGIWNWAIRPHEEADLAARFGAEFEAYRARVGCWWPTLAPLVTEREGRL